MDTKFVWIDCKKLYLWVTKFMNTKKTSIYKENLEDTKVIIKSCKS